MAEMDKAEVSGLKPTKSVKGKKCEVQFDATQPDHLFDAIFGFLFTEQSSEKDVPAHAKIVKHTRDFVLHVENETTAIRRSPIWLFLKVVLQQELRHSKAMSDYTLYKQFMVLFFALLLDSACDRKLDSHTVHCMRRKIGYRMWKLQDKAVGPWMKNVQHALAKANGLLNTRWEKIVKHDQNLQATTLPQFLADATDCTVTHSELDVFLAKVSQTPPQTNNHVADPRSGIISWGPGKLPNMNQLGDESSQTDIFNLIMVETWVEDYLFGFIRAQIKDECTCSDIRSFAMAYFKRAHVVYKDLPDHMSIMYLTLLELWIASDMSAVARNPSLREYTPLGVEDICWEALLLQRKRDLSRLSQAEEYIRCRSVEKMCMMANYGTADCFSFRFVQASVPHMALRATIDRDEDKNVEEKAAELERLIKKQKLHLDFHEKMQCDPTICRIGTGQHPCERCSHLVVARELTINPYLKTLPDDEHVANAVVFELRPPADISAWRDFCFFLQLNVTGQSKPKGGPSFYSYLHNYGMFEPYAQKNALNSDPRICAASPSPKKGTKDPIQVRQDLKLSEICLPHPMKWRLFDSDEGNSIEDIKRESVLHETCRIELDEGNTFLQKLSCSPTPDNNTLKTANELIAMRLESENTSVLKHNEELGSLYLCNHATWPKILRELRGTSIDWTALETFSVILQVALRAGPKQKQSELRQKNAQLHDDAFSTEILDEILRVLGIYTASFSGRTALAVFCTIVIKILSEASDACHAKAYHILRIIRNTCFDWMRYCRMNSPWDCGSIAWQLLKQRSGGWLLKQHGRDRVVMPATVTHYEELSQIFQHFKTEDDFRVILNREKETLEHDRTQRVLVILDGEETVLEGSEHVDIYIGIKEETTVQVYTIDDFLRQLKGNQTWRSKAWLAYLSALTSHPLPDPFTSRTGQETAFEILTSSAILSFDALEANDLVLLQKIGEYGSHTTAHDADYYFRMPEPESKRTKGTVAAVPGKFDYGSSSGLQRAYHAAYGAKYRRRFNSVIPSPSSILGQMTIAGTIKGVTKHYDAHNFRYTPKWASTVESTLVEDLCSVHNALSKSIEDRNPFRLRLWLSTVASGMEGLESSIIIPILSALVNENYKTGFEIPTTSNTNNSRGTKYSADQIVKVLNEAKCMHQSSPFAIDAQTLQSREKFHQTQEEIISSLAERIAKNGPVDLSPHRAFLNVFPATESIRELLKIWNLNKKWYKHEQCNKTHVRMRNRPKGENAVMQLNMGEGKSSIIIPILSASLAQGKTLVRVFAGRHQSKQMMDTLITTMSGLMDRPVFCMPFNRDSKLSAKSILKVKESLLDCVNNGGVLLLQPEHHLSLLLSTSLNEEPAATKNYVSLLKYINTTSRDIIDECDELLSPTYELLYTIGTPGPIDLAPDRWLLIQGLLEQVKNYSNPESKIITPNQVLYQINPKHPDAFPSFCFLTSASLCVVLTEVAREFATHGFTGFSVSRYEGRKKKANAIKKAIFEYITMAEPPEKTVKEVEKLGEIAKSSLALVRGCIAGDVLRVPLLRKRWRVDYGCDFRRTPPTRLAVPFSAKDVPKPRAEFSNTDVVIIFTQLSYYHSGLHEQHVRDLIEHMLTSDDGYGVYGHWFENSNSSMPVQLQKLKAVNLQDDKQFYESFYPNIRYSIKAIDHFLSRLVFPTELGAFSQHMAASGWDLAEVKAHPTTGFSGTTDQCELLPLDMKQLNLPTQAHTNALVLNNILSTENTVLSVHTELEKRSFDGSDLIDHVIKDGQIRVILDVGAQVIKLSNRQVAERWLQQTQDSTIKAVLFCDDSDALSVIDRSGTALPLKVSVYANKLDACAVFLDEAHTRGTDLRLPPNYKAAVTLGPGLTKDRLAQACMRMRNLGNGQTLVFYVSFEVENSIRSLLRLSDEQPLTIDYIIQWSILQTQASITRQIPHWAKQGRRHGEQAEAWKCLQYGISKSSSGDIDETCEREVAPEVEDEKQISKPPNPVAMESFHNRALDKFIETGQIDDELPGLEWAYQSLRRTTLRGMLKKLKFPRTLRVTRDFAQAVDTDDPTDAYQHHVAYVLHIKPVLARHGDLPVVVIITQSDLEIHWSAIDKSKMVDLHLYNAKVTPEAARRVGHIYPLNIACSYTHPTTTRIALDLFAGQLYFGSYHEYIEVSSFLGLAYFDDTKDIEVDPDGFIPSHERHKIPAWHRHANQYWDTFDVSPVPFLKRFLGVVRSHGAGIEHTHMGRILDGERLGSKEFPDYKARGPEDVEPGVKTDRGARIESKAQRDRRMQMQGKRRREGGQESNAEPALKRPRLATSKSAEAAIVRAQNTSVPEAAADKSRVAATGSKEREK
ncbi:hypothetical protein MY5147_005505 [Beauveria neobassiana]